MTFDLVPEIPRLRRYAAYLTRTSADADDLLQDCLLRALEKRHLWHPISPLAAWLGTVMHGLHVNDLRAAARRVAVREPRGSAASPERSDIGVIVRDGVRALERLPPEMRRVLAARTLGGMSYGEIAEREGVPVGTVRSRLSRGREALRGSDVL